MAPDCRSRKAHFEAGSGGNQGVGGCSRKKVFGLPSDGVIGWRLRKGYREFSVRPFLLAQARLSNPFVYNREIGLPQFLQENGTYFVRLGEPKFLRPQVSAQRVDLGPFPFGANVSPFRAMSCGAHVSALRFSRAELASLRPRLGVNRPVFSPSPEAGYPLVYPREELVNSRAKLTGPRRTRPKRKRDGVG